jgi:LysM repeat protein
MATGVAAASVNPVTNNLPEYTVVKGDNPYKIAKKFRITPDELMKINGITDPKKIQIGQKLKIPAPQKKAAK